MSEQVQDTQADGQVAQNVADGQSVVDSVYEDTSRLIDDAVLRIESDLEQVRDGGETQALTDEQWQRLDDFNKLNVTLGFVSCLGIWCVVGCLVGAQVVRGWRRG